jgi:hypothetical protein
MFLSSQRLVLAQFPMLVNHHFRDKVADNKFACNRHAKVTKKRLDWRNPMFSWFSVRYFDFPPTTALPKVNMFEATVVALTGVVIMYLAENHRFE